LRAVETPEGVDLALRVAGPYVRVLAYAFDFLLRFVIQSVVGAALGWLAGVGTAVQLILWFALEWLYPVVFEVYAGGATPGKRLLGLTVVLTDGRPVGMSQSLLRNLMRAVDFAPLFYVAGLASMLASRDFQRLGDRVAGTLVTHVREPRLGRELAKASALAPTVSLELAEQAALVEFSQRSASWGPSRAAEIADNLEPLTGERGASGVARALGMASWVGGER
jgi:uncharacterized RDD family membrane protein YckC